MELQQYVEHCDEIQNHAARVKVLLAYNMPEDCKREIRNRIRAMLKLIADLSAAVA